MRLKRRSSSARGENEFNRQNFWQNSGLSSGPARQGREKLSPHEAWTINPQSSAILLYLVRTRCHHTRGAIYPAQ
eukprot:scaffold27729_cov100-Skeletonema_dohrnii-CCMP3373.AAC.1